jgi:alpha-amylase
MKSLCFYFQVHQPFRLRTYRFFDIGENHYYFDEYRNRYIMKRIADKCYLPMNQLLLDLINQYGKDFKVSFSVSGMALEQFRMYAPKVLESFQKLAATGSVEFIAETYAHSLAALRSKSEFFNQVNLQAGLVKELFGQTPQTFRNTELIYSDLIGADVAELGYKTMLTEGAKHILGWKSPNFMYCNAINPKLKLLLKNYQLSDDIAFRFSQQSWNGWPLTAEKFTGWLNELPAEEETVNLFMDYETFGEHQWPETGIFEFMKALPARIFSDSNYRFHTPAEVSDLLQPIAAVHVPHPISWADEERDLTAWLGNELQTDAFNRVYELEHLVSNSGDEEIVRDWRYLQTSDHFYYMCTKWFSDGDVHKYFNPYNSPYEAYVNYMNILSDFMLRLNENFNPAGNKVVEAKADIKAELKKAAGGKKTTAAVRKTQAKKPVSTAKAKGNEGERQSTQEKTLKAKKSTAPAKKAVSVKTVKPAKESIVVTKPVEKKQATSGRKVAVSKKPAIAKSVLPKIQTESVSETYDLGFLLQKSDTAMFRALKKLDAFTIGLAIMGADKKIIRHVMNNVGIRTREKLDNMTLDAAEFHPRELERCRKKVADSFIRRKTKS